MRVHHINCATMCPVAWSLFKLPDMVCHCLLVETNAGLVLVDTGVGMGDIEDPARLGAGFVRVVRPRLDPAETAVRRVDALGFKKEDVRHVVPTHLDLDHAGGLGDFPKAKVHIFKPELDAALARATFVEGHRYRPAHWAHGPEWKPYTLEGETWHGFDCVRGLEGLPPEILIVPLVGHTRGHSGVAVQTARGWMIHAGDAYFFRKEMDPERPRCPAPLAIFQSTMAFDDVARRRNQERLRLLVRDNKIDAFCAHDPVELQRHESGAHPYS